MTTRHRTVRRADIRLDLEVADLASVQVTARVIADPGLSGPRMVCFGFPGGGYNRLYWDLEHDLLEGPTQAEFHAARGVVFIACDPFGGGDGTPLDAELRGLETTIAAWDLAARQILAALQHGALVDWLPAFEVSRTIAMGHSLGGMQLIAHQARYRRFDAVAILGWSAVHTTVPTPDGDLMPAAHGEAAHAGDLEDAWAGPMIDEVEHIRYAYHWEDVDPVLVAEDMSVGFPTRHDGVLPLWITRTFPPFAAICLTPGVVADDAALITTPVCVALGQRDVARNVRDEPHAYASSRDITVIEIPRCGHMHNFSPQRTLLWHRLQSWLDAAGIFCDPPAA